MTEQRTEFTAVEVVTIAISVATAVMQAIDLVQKSREQEPKK